MRSPRRCSSSSRARTSENWSWTWGPEENGMSAVMERNEAKGATADVLVIRLDNPPVNGLAHAVRKAVVDGLAAAEADPAVKAVVIVGTGNGFSGGADIREFGSDKMVAEPNLG